MYTRYYDSYPARVPDNLLLKEEKAPETVEISEVATNESSTIQDVMQIETSSKKSEKGGFLQSVQADDIILVALLFLLLSESDDIIMLLIIGFLLLGDKLPF